MNPVDVLQMLLIDKHAWHMPNKRQTTHHIIMLANIRGHVWCDYEFSASPGSRIFDSSVKHPRESFSTTNSSLAI